MTQGRIFVAAWVILLCSIALSGYVSFHASERVSTIQQQLLISQKASTETRVKTVASRCDLTQLILVVLTRVHDQQDAAPFQASYAKCLVQLAQVQHINAVTPSAG